MKSAPDIHHRKSIRLKGYDYSQAGAYFVTICAKNRENLFGIIVDVEMGLNDAGRMVEPRQGRGWQEIPGHFPHADLDAFVVMPNHFHGILTIMTDVGANNHSPQPSHPARANNYSPLQFSQQSHPSRYGAWLHWWR